MPPAAAKSQSPFAVVPVLAGIGNAVMTVPLVRALAALAPPGHGEVVVAARTGAMADVFGRLPEVGRVVTLGGEFRAAWRAHRGLARARPASYVVPFPSNRWQYALLAATGGAGRIVMHDYPTGGLRGGRVALRRATLVPAERGLHDVTQNLRLLAPLRLDESRLPAGVRRPVFPLDDDDRRAGRAMFEGEGFVVVQAGCGDTVVGRAKRPPTRFFSELCDALANGGREVIVVEGPDERGVGRAVSAGSASRPPVVELRGKLGAAAALLERAGLYVGVDSGLAHVAAAVGTPPVTLFAAADPSRVAPFDYGDLVVTPPPVDGKIWSPRLLYPMDHPGPRLRDDGVDWAAHLRLADVLAAVERATASPAAGVGRHDRRDLAVVR